MGGLDELALPNENKKLTAVVQESQCPLCKYTFREPFSGSCKHPCCKSCLAVFLTRDLPELEDIRCPTCGSPLRLDELKPDQAAQRRLQKIKTCRCKNCNWKGSYNEYIQNHEKACGGGARIQCKVLGCGKWLPEKRALDVHRTDEWCPMILIMKARLNQAEIVHLSMRESWDWTCGLVLRSEKSSVQDLIMRLVVVFSKLDPKVPITLENDEYAANQTNEAESQSQLSNGESNQVENKQNEKQRENRSSGRSSPEDTPDGKSLDRRTLSSILSPRASEASGATNGYFREDDDSFLDKQFHETSSFPKESLKSLQHDIRRGETERQRVKKDLDHLVKTVDDLINIPRALAAIHDKQELFQGVLATFNKDVMAVHERLDKLNLSPNLFDHGFQEKVQKKYQELERSITSLHQYKQRVDDRLVTLEASHTGVFLWKIDNYNERKRDAMNTNVKSIYSVPFYTSQYGYKLCGRVFLMGDGVGKGTHISLFLTIMKGPYDAVLPWPFRERITFQLVNQDDPTNKSIVEAFRPDPSSSSFKKPTTEKNIGAGCPLFAKIQVIEDPNSGFVRDNTIYLKIISQTSDVPEIK